MTPDLFLTLGICLAILTVPIYLSALADLRSKRTSIICALIAAGRLCDERGAPCDDRHLRKPYKLGVKTPCSFEIRRVYGASIAWPAGWHAESRQDRRLQRRRKCLR